MFFICHYGNRTIKKDQEYSTPIKTIHKKLKIATKTLYGTSLGFEIIRYLRYKNGTIGIVKFWGPTIMKSTSKRYLG